jgi:hypothetical protein
LTENYIVSEAKFPISIWAEMTSSFERTTNACESFYSKFFLSTSRHLYILKNIKRKIQIDIKIAIKAATKKTMKKKGTTNNKIAFIEKNINKFKNNQISRIDFVKNMACKHQA